MTTLAPATSKDLGAVRNLLDAAGLPHADLTAEHLDHFLLLRDGGAVAGSVGLEVLGEDALLRSLAVAPSRRGEGLGRWLVEAAEARARREGVAALWLLTETAAPFFARLGYQTAERSAAPPRIQATAEFDALCGASAVCMMKRL